MIGLVLNRQQNKRNIQLSQDTKGETVGYLLPDGESRFVRWLGFISRERARTLRGAVPVRLVNISRIGQETAVGVSWDDIGPEQRVHGCVTSDGAYAVYEAKVSLVSATKSRSNSANIGV